MRRFPAGHAMGTLVDVSTTDAPTAPAAMTPGHFREVLGHYPTGVTVVTGMVDDEPVGMVVGTFTSVSLDPPLVGFLPDRSSTTWPLIREAGSFCVNVLAAEHRELSVGFARSGSAVDKFAGVDWCPAPSGAPVLEGVSAWIDATLWAEYDGGDHTVVVGHVHDLGADPSRLPLLFYRGGYGVG
jgi:flavin reductase (DIM6/NTAB) family NADH-FMN oxidoreductase RutF